MAIICACLPVLRVVIITFGHRYLGWSMVGSAIGGNDKPTGSSGGYSHGTRASASTTARRARMSQSRHHHNGVTSAATAAAAGGPTDGPRGDFIRLDDLEHGPVSRDGADDDDDTVVQQGPSEKGSAEKAAGRRNTIVVTRKISIRSDV